MSAAQIAGLLVTGCGCLVTALMCFSKFKQSDYMQDANIMAHFSKWSTPAGFSSSEFWALLAFVVLTPIAFASLGQFLRVTQKATEIPLLRRLVLLSLASVAGTACTLWLLFTWGAWWSQWDFDQWRPILNPECTAEGLNNCADQNGFAMSTSVCLVLASAAWCGCSWRAVAGVLCERDSVVDSYQPQQGLISKQQQPEAALWNSVVARGELGWTQRMQVVLFLALFLPGCWVLSMVLPNHPKIMSTSEVFLGNAPGSSGQQSWPGSVNSLVGSGSCVLNTTAGEYGMNRHCADGVGATVNLMVWTDVAIYYCALYVLLLGVLSARAIPALRRLLHRRWKLAGVLTLSVGQLLLCGWLVVLVVVWILFWKGHLWEGRQGTDVKQVWARVLGQLANLFMGLLMLPVSRSSVLWRIFGVSWEQGIAVHRLLGYATLLCSAAHMFNWWVVWAHSPAKGDPGHIPGQTGAFPHDILAVPLDFHSDNFTVPLMQVLWIALFAAMGGLAFHKVRRWNFELFYYSHQIVAVTTLVGALFHATSLWYFLVGGLALWVLDRLVRFHRGCRAVRVVSMSCKTASNVCDIEVEAPGFVFEPGQYCFINIPQVSLLEWHPFTICAAPHHDRLRFCIKSNGEERPGSFTHQLHQLAKDCDSAVMEPVSIVMSIDGPYGTPPDTSEYDHVMLVAGGIGVTPCASILMDWHARKRCKVGSQFCGAREPTMKLVWSVRDLSLGELLLASPQQDQETPECAPVHASWLELYHTAKSQPNRLDVLGNAQPSPERAGVISGRPNFAEVLSPDKFYGRVLVFVCGGRQMAEDVSEIALQHGYDYHAETFEL